MPDNLAEDIDVVVEGTLQANELLGDKVITRCASKYQPADSVDARDQQSAKYQPPSTVHSMR